MDVRGNPFGLPIRACMPKVNTHVSFVPGSVDLLGRLSVKSACIA